MKSRMKPTTRSQVIRGVILSWSYNVQYILLIVVIRYSSVTHHKRRIAHLHNLEGKKLESISEQRAVVTHILEFIPLAFTDAFLLTKRDLLLVQSGVVPHHNACDNYSEQKSVSDTGSVLITTHRRTSRSETP
jgi:hypothetical protein